MTDLAENTSAPRRVLAVMQPYIFPYIGYFQLIEAADKFIFYDDVDYILGGWINRNRILLNGKPFLFTVPLRKASTNKLIKDTETVADARFVKKFGKQLKSAYAAAPNYAAVSERVIDVIAGQAGSSIAEMAAASVKTVYDYLGLSFNGAFSSDLFPDLYGTERADRLIAMCKRENASHYVNPRGGVELYSKDYFADCGVALQFLQADLNAYDQKTAAFVPGLSIIDVLMYNHPDRVVEMIRSYHLQ